MNWENKVDCLENELNRRAVQKEFEVSNDGDKIQNI